MNYTAIVIAIMASVVIMSAVVMEVDAQTRLDKRISPDDFYRVGPITGNVLAGATGEQNALCDTGDRITGGSAIVNVFVNNRSNLATSYEILEEGEQFDAAGGRINGWFIKVDNTGRSDLGLIITANCVSMAGVS